ncbi:MAG: hypothetical protein WC649_09220 [Desulfobacteria bacterium]
MDLLYRLNAALSGVPKGHPSPVPGSPGAKRRAGTTAQRRIPPERSEGGTMLLSDKTSVAEIGFFVK